MRARPQPSPRLALVSGSDQIVVGTMHGGRRLIAKRVTLNTADGPVTTWILKTEARSGRS